MQATTCKEAPTPISFLQTSTHKRLPPQQAPTCYLSSYNLKGDLGGCWWPPAYSTWTPTIISFSFSVSLIVAQYTIFYSFSGPELPEPFWGPKWRFLGTSELISVVDQCCIVESCIPWIYLSNEVLCASNRDCMPKLRPREVDVPIYPNGAHSFGVSSPGIGFLDV